MKIKAHAAISQAAFSHTEAVNSGEVLVMQLTFHKQLD